jgi:two-component system, chemotaxis family, sensor kinase CheA
MTVKGLEKLRTLFAQEAEQRLGRLSQLVLELEQREVSDLAEVIAEIFREVHTLKGSAAVVGFEDIGTYAHGVEDKLGQLRSGAVVITAAIVDALLVAVDRLGSMIWESVEGQAVDESASTSALALLDVAFLAVEATEPAAAVEPIDALDPIVALDPSPPSPSRPRAAARRKGAIRDGAGTVMVPVERLDELVRMVGEAAAAHLRVGRVCSDRLGLDAISMPEFSELSRVLNSLQECAMRTRMVPVSTITDSLQRAVRDAARSLGKDVRWEVRGEDTELDREVLHQLADSLLHLVRNAVDHGVDTPEQRVAAGKPAQAVVRLHAMQLGSEVIIAVNDDGDGVNVERVRAQAIRLGMDVEGLNDDETIQLIFASGFSTAKFVSDISGRGVGLDAVRSSVDAARGRVEVRSTPGAGSEFRIVVPITLAVLRCLLVESGGQRFALPLHRVVLAQAESTATLLHAEGQRMIKIAEKPVPVFDLADLLGIRPTRVGAGTFVVVNGAAGQTAFVVDSLAGQRDVVVKALSPLVPRLDVVAGTSIEPDGSILLVLDPPGLIERSRRGSARSALAPAPATGEHRRSGRLLVVDDALTVRELQRTILERAGFDVTVACDGVEALAFLDNEEFDLVLTDVEMPRMNGFALTEHIRAQPGMRNVAVLILTSLASDTDRQRGMDAGADGYIAKSDFDEKSLLAAVDRLVGISS